MKLPLIAVVLLSVGFALGWAFKPNDSIQTAAPEAQAASASSTSILDSSPSMAGSPSGGMGTKPGAAATVGAPKDGIALLELFAADGNMRDQLAGYQKLSRLNETQVRELAVSLAKAPKNDTRLWQARNALFNRWADIAPEALFAFSKDAMDKQARHQGVSAACRALGKQDLSKVRELFETVSDRELRQNMLYPIVSAGTAKDPEAMLAFLSGENSESAQGAYRNLFRVWAREDPLAAAGRLGAVPAGRDRSNALSGLASSWGQSDPKAALDWALGLGNYQERLRALRYVMENGSEGGIGGSAALLDGLDLNTMERNTATKALARSAMQSDMEGTLKWMETLPAQLKAEVLGENFNHIMSQDAKRAQELFMDNLGTNVRHYADDIAGRLVEEDLASAQTWVESLPAGGTRNDALQGVMSKLGRSDPKAAAVYLDEIGLTESNSHLASNMVSTWMQSDRQSALAWIEGQEDPKVRDQLIPNMVSAWSKEDPAGAATYANAIEDPGQRQNALQNVMNQWAQQDLDGARQFVDRLDTADQPKVVKNLIRNVSNNDIESAVALLEDYMPTFQEESDQREMASAAGNLAGRWADSDIHGAADWATSLIHEAASTEAMKAVANDWADMDSMGASEWIGQLPAGAGRDGAVTALVDRIQNDDPSSAFAWVSSIGDDNQRQSQMSQVISRWKSKDLDAALRALNSANLDDDSYNKLARQFEN